MDLFSHLLIGTFISALPHVSISWEYVVFAFFMSILADFDVLLTPLQRAFDSYYLSHKSASHSYLIAIFVSFIAGLIFYIVVGGSFFRAWIFGFLFYSLHISLDLLTTSKIPALYPISRKEWRLYADRAVNPILLFYNMSLMTLFVIFWQMRLALDIYFELAWIFLSVYLIYFSYKIITRLWTQFRLPENCLFIPGMVPLIYMVYETNESEEKLSFKLTKKRQLFKKSMVIIETEIKKGTKEMDFYERAKSISKTFRFFVKWEGILPMIIEEEEFITVKMFMAESFASRSAYIAFIIFDKESGEVILKVDGFDRVFEEKKSW